MIKIKLLYWPVGPKIIVFTAEVLCRKTKQKTIKIFQKMHKNAKNKNNDSVKLVRHLSRNNNNLKHAPEISKESRKDRTGFPGQLAGRPRVQYRAEPEPQGAR
jgi:hypothetical protein